MNLRKLGKDELDCIFKSLEMSDSEKSIILTFYFNEGTNDVEYYSFKKDFSKENLQSDELDKINLNITSKIKYYATTERDLNLELLAPELYKQFSEPDKIVFFVGAGLSRVIGYPSWDGLADKAIDELKINYYSKERIKSSIKDPLQKLSFFESYNKHESEEYKNFYSKNFNSCEFGKHENPYDLLVSREFRAAFITTNIDTEIAKALTRKDSESNINEPDNVNNIRRQDKDYLVELDVSKLKQDRVAMIHGRHDEPLSLIMSNFDYIKNYYRNDKISSFLKDVFKQKTVIFIGYGLAELPILATIIDSEKTGQSLKDYSVEKSGSNNHYLLLDSFENERSLQNVYRNYFSNFNINILPYHLDEDGYERIITVLKSWRNALRSEKEGFIEDTFIIERFLESGTNFELAIKKIKQKENQVLFNQFFTGIDKPEYFSRLKEEGFFETNRFPKPDNNLSPFYPPLSYLEKIVIQFEKMGDIHNPIINEIVSIITKVSEEYKIENFQNINTTTIWYFIRIINHLPNSILTKDFINEVICLWIKNFVITDWNFERILNVIFLKLCTIEDVPKAELILTFILLRTDEIENKDVDDNLDFRYLIKDNMEINVFFDNCSSDFILFLADIINYLRVKNHPIKFEFEKDNTKYLYKAKLISNKIFEFYLTDISSEVVIKKGEISFNCYADEKEIKEKIVTSLNGYSQVDDSNIDLYYFLHWGRQSFRLDDDIFDDDVHYRKNFIKVLSEFLKRILIAKAKSKPQEITPIIQNFFDIDYSIPFFKQLTLTIIEVNFNYFSQFFLDIILDEKLWNSNLNFGFENDVQTFLRRNQNQLRNEHLDKLSLIIQDIGKKYKADDEDFQRKIDFEKLEWLDALKENGTFKVQYDILNAKYKLEPDYFSSRGKVKYYSGEVSPFSVEELLSLKVSELYSALINFNQIDKYRFEDPSVRGLVNTVRKVAELNSKKVLELFEYNQAIPIPYMNGILEGIKVSFKNNENKADFDEDRLFKMVLHYIQASDFKENKLIIDEYYRDHQKEWFVSEIAQLLEEYLKNKTQKVECEETIRLILQTISKLLSELIGDSYSEKDGKQLRDYNLNYVLNSSKGKVLSVLFEFAWYKKSTSNEGFLDPLVKETFIHAFTKGYRDAYILFGTYLAQFISIDKAFAYEWIKKIQKSEDEEWKCFFGGWLFFKMQYCSSEIYVKLKPHFKRALNLKFYSEDFQNSGLIRSILIAYYWGYEGIKGPIFQKMLKESSLEILCKVLNYTGTDYYEFQKHEMLDSTRIRILVLWKELKSKFESVTEEGIEKARFDMIELIRYWDKIDLELFELLEYSIYNFKPGINVGDLIEELDRLFEINEENSVYISQLVFMLTEKKYVPFSEGEYGGEIYDLLEKLALIKNDSIIQDIKEACTNLIKNSNGLQKRGIAILKKLEE